MKSYHSENTLEVGVDEVGRGPLFGRVYAAAVAWPPYLESALIRDSKDPMFKRAGVMDKAVAFIKEHAVAWGIGYVDEKVVDKKNILQATMDAMHTAIDNCGILVDQVLVDGNYFRLYNGRDGEPVSYVTVEKGDSTYFAIAAASILAKSSRDNYIAQLCAQYPELQTRYDLLSNKGYGSRAHTDGIKTYGITQFHRKTFGLCKTSAVNIINGIHETT